LLIFYNEMDKTLVTIEKKVWSLVPNENRIGIMDGLSGIALFYNSLYKVYGLEEYKDKLLIVISKINRLISEEDTPSTLCSGVAGYGLMLLKLENDLVEIDDQYFETIDALLEEELIDRSSSNNYDYLHGAMGIAYYFIERNKIKRDDLLINILDKFSSELIGKINKNFEDVLIESVFGDKHGYYFGLAHGAAGYLNFLIYLKRNFKDLKQDIDGALQVIVSFLREHKKAITESKQYYPNLLILETNLIMPPILAWCQGDFGIFNALYNTGLHLNDDKLKGDAIELIDNIKKISFEDSGVRDYGMCHGTMGIIMQFKLASIRTETNFNKEINKWHKILEKETKGFDEFLTYHNGTYRNEVNLIDGLTGLGLGVLTLNKQISHQWLEIFNLH
jgi:lantibiotic modifying enzyme